MTLVSEGTIAGREFAVVPDARTGEAKRWVCIRCGVKTPLDRERFAAHTCATPRAARESTTTPAAAPPASEGEEGK